jgi:hypothetical protein
MKWLSVSRQLLLIATSAILIACEPADNSAQTCGIKTKLKSLLLSQLHHLNQRVMSKTKAFV